MKRRVLVTGGAGFLGSHLCDRLIAQGDEVLAVDNFLTGRMQNVRHLHDNRRFEIIRHDVTSPLHAEVDQIYNMACPASPVHYQRDPVQTTKTIVLGAINMLELAERVNAPILQASTSEIYGDPEQHPQTEEYRGHVSCVGPRACYDEGKRCAETLFFDYQRQSRADVRVVRIFNTYGPRMHPDDGRVVSNFIVQALRSEPITIYGDGEQTRSFCYVDDLIDGLLKLMAYRGPDLGPINIGNPIELPVVELARRIIGLCGSRSKVETRALPQDDPCRRRPNIDLAEKLLDWHPQVGLDEGLLMTMAYFDSLLTKPREAAHALARSVA